MKKLIEVVKESRLRLKEEEVQNHAGDFISSSLGMEKILEINNLNKSFQDFALKDISFLWNQDILWALLGLMVSKSTTIKLIMNLLKRIVGNQDFW